MLTGLLVLLTVTPGVTWAGKIKVVPLQNPNPQIISWFGWSVQSVGDLNGDAVPDLAVSAPQQSVSGIAQQGTVRIFSGADRTFLFTLDSPVSGFGAIFGEAIRAVGDVNGDGRPDILVGARLQSIDGNDGQGQAYVFSGMDGSWLGVTLKAPIPQGGAFFGAALATINDQNQDGKRDVIVGAPQQSFGDNQSEGAVFVMSPVNGQLLSILLHPNPQTRASFGFAVESLGDVNGDAVTDFAVSAPFQIVEGRPSQGQVYVFSGANRQRLYTLNTPEPIPSARFGFAVAAMGDVNNDGIGDILVGAPTADLPSIRNAGRAFISSGADGTVLHVLNDPSPVENGMFGAALASPGDFDGDGVTDVAIGAPAPVSSSQGVFSTGEVLLFSGATGNHLLTVNDPSPESGSTFGFSIVGAGDVDKDGVSDLLIGAPFHDVTVDGTVVESVGNAFVFRKLSPDLKGKIIEVVNTTDVSGQDRLFFTVEVKNKGTVKTTVPFRIKAHISNDSVYDGGKIDPKLEKWKISQPLLPGEKVVLDGAVAFDESVAGKFFILRVDPSKKIKEGKEKNNTKSIRIVR